MISSVQGEAEKPTCRDEDFVRGRKLIINHRSNSEPHITPFIWDTSRLNWGRMSLSSPDLGAMAVAPGAGWSWSRTRSAYTRVESVAASGRVWLVVEDDRFMEHPFMFIVIGAECVVCIDTGIGVPTRGTARVGGAAPRIDGLSSDLCRRGNERLCSRGGRGVGAEGLRRGCVQASARGDQHALPFRSYRR
jgi:hypothetical protein